MATKYEYKNILQLLSPTYILNVYKMGQMTRIWHVNVTNHVTYGTHIRKLSQSFLTVHDKTLEQTGIYVYAHIQLKTKKYKQPQSSTSSQTDICHM